MPRVFIVDKEGSLIGKGWIEVSPKGGWVAKDEDFKLVEKGFTPVEGIQRYDAIIVNEIIERREKGPSAKIKSTTSKTTRKVLFSGTFPEL